MTTLAHTEQALPAGTWTLDPVHSQVGFAIRHSGVSLFRGTIDSFEAELADGTLRGSADVSSIRVSDENLNAHLLSPDFFDATRFPKVTFTSTAPRRDGDELVVEGELELRGERRPVTLTGTVSGPVGDRLGVSLETAIDRTAFGMSWNMELPSGGFALDNEVRLRADLELVQG